MTFGIAYGMAIGLAYGMGPDVACLTTGVCHLLWDVGCGIKCGMWCMAFHMAL